MKTGGALRRPRLRAACLLVLLSAAPAFAECSADKALNLMLSLENRDWGAPESEEFESTEGPGYRDTYRSAGGDIRVDEDFCVSYYCANTFEVRTAEDHSLIVFLTWGGVNFPETTELSVVLGDVSEGTACVVSQQGETRFGDGAVELVEHMMGFMAD